MARGDVVNNVVYVSDASYLNFQPAAGVEVMITLASLDREVGVAKDTRICWSGSGVYTVFDANQTAAIVPELNMRMFINNTNYFSVYSSVATSVGYSGIQTK